MNSSISKFQIRESYGIINNCTSKILDKGNEDFWSVLSTFLTITLLFMVSVKVLFGLGRNGNNKDKSEVTASAEIPIHSFLPITPPLGIRLPAVIETLLSMAELRRDGVKLMENVAVRYRNKSAIIKVPILSDFVAVALRPSIIQKILGSSSKHFLNKPEHFYKHLMPKGLVRLEAETWHVHRKILNKCFNFRALQAFAGIMNKHGRHLVEDLLDKANSNDYQIIEAKYVNDRLYFDALNLITEIIIGEEIFTKEENKTFHFHFSEAKALAVYRIYNPHNLLPFIWWMNPRKKLLDRHWSERRKFVALAIQRCKERIQTKTSDQGNAAAFRSIIEEMICNNVPEKEIRNEVSTFLLAGHDTTVGALIHFLQHIAEHPEIQIRCQAEVDGIFNSKKASSPSEKDDDRRNNNNFMELTMNDLSNLKYLERCILETLRITPLIPFVFRQLSAPMEVEGKQFEKDEVFMVPIWVIHRDPNLYPNPEKFDPDRFLPENLMNRSACSFLPFSQGPRNCIGYKVAMMEMKIILGWILRHFNISTKDRLGDLKMFFDSVTRPERDYKITLTKRK